MEKESVLQRIMIDAQSEIFLKPEKDFPIGESKYYRIIDGSYVRTLFIDNKPECSSDDTVTGKSRKTNDRRKCADCPQSDDCTVSCRLVLTNLLHGNVYYLTIPRVAQVALSQYVEKLLMNNLDAPDVVTKITRIKNSKFSTYTYELAFEWFTDDLLKTSEPIFKAYTPLDEEAREDFNLSTMLKLAGIPVEVIKNMELLVNKHE